MCKQWPSVNLFRYPWSCERTVYLHQASSILRWMPGCDDERGSLPTHPVSKRSSQCCASQIPERKAHSRLLHKILAQDIALLLGHHQRFWPSTKPKRLIPHTEYIISHFLICHILVLVTDKRCTNKKVEP